MKAAVARAREACTARVSQVLAAASEAGEKQKEMSAAELMAVGLGLQQWGGGAVSATAPPPPSSVSGSSGGGKEEGAAASLQAVAAHTAMALGSPTTALRPAGCLRPVLESTASGTLLLASCSSQLAESTAWGGNIGTQVSILAAGGAGAAAAAAGGAVTKRLLVPQLAAERGAGAVGTGAGIGGGGWGHDR